MERFTALTAIAAPIDQANIDTDQIAPARFLRRPRAEGYQDILFHDLRFTAPGVENPDFILNRAPFRQARILVADRNFGGGSSREQAVWALVDSGIRCVVAVSFGDIFYNNAVNHGLLLVRLDAELLRRLRQALHERPGSVISVDLRSQTLVAPDGTTYAFAIEAARKRRLLEGLDAIGLTLGHMAEIAAFEQGYQARKPWLTARPA
ncbi:3-isopropylmalate dehydratase small subunit [Crenalkalicoccus roseus]|uniref:3-isopropylmalate dehydratase small subunit n=1 Tax=Crenalkalicoccus roseus TaxID=1485588 RepID=UPI0010817D78|nr:3-isopropylmalate dehydratase small subunit [Crenalkalicoccus roseus]